MSADTILLIILGFVYLISVVAYFKKTIHQLTHTEGKEITQKQADIKSNPSRGKVYYITSETRY